MDIRQLQDKLRDLSDKLPGEGADRIKLAAVALVLPVLLIWLLYYVVTSMIPPPAAKALDTPGWRIAADLNIKLNTEPQFRDVGFAVETERPLKFAINGAVHHANDLPKLVEKLKELRPEGDYELYVEVLAPGPQ